MGGTAVVGAPSLLQPGVGPQGGNTQLPYFAPEYREHPLNAEQLEEGVLALHRFPVAIKPGRENTAVHGRKDEQPWHRMAALMLLAGNTNREIAECAGVTPATVSQLRANLWFQQLVATLAAQSTKGILGLIEAEAVASIETVAAIRDNAEKDSTRLSAAIWLAEQVTGKAVQKILSSNQTTLYASPREEMDDIQKQLATIRGMETVAQPSVSPQPAGSNSAEPQ